MNGPCVKPTLRDGTATLELVMSMPILLAIIVGIIWLGSSVIAQTEVTVEARHKAWTKRSEPSGQSLLFLNDDIVNDRATRQVDVSSLFADAEPPESSHELMAGPWDYEKLPLDKVPNWKQYAIAAANAKTGGLQTNYVDARNQFSRFKSESRTIWKTLATDLIRQLTSLGNTVSSMLKFGKDAEDGKKAKERASINRMLDAKKRELTEARNELRRLDEDASKALKDVLKNRVKRLKSDVEDLEADLEAIE